MKSIRTYLLTRLLCGSALVLSVAGASVYVVASRSLEVQFDRNLSDRVQGFVSILFQVENELDFEFSDELMPEYELGVERPEYFQLWFPDGRIVERSNSLAGGDLSVPELDQPAFEGETPVHWTAPLPDGRAGRYIAQELEVHHVYPEEGPDRPRAARVRVVVARGTETLAAAEREVLLACFGASLVLLGLFACLSWLAVKQGLAPARRLAAALDEIEVERLPDGLDVGALPEELVPVGRKTDALIRRVERALERERRTTADIAHELRTPISEVLTVAEVALRNGVDPEHTRGALATVREVAWRMGRSVATLLKLARIEMGDERFERGAVDLSALLADVLRTLRTLGGERGIEIENRVGAGSVVEADRDVLQIIVSNLLTNALRYAPRKSTVECRLERPDGRWRFVVSNEAPELRAEDLGSLTEPFWRKDRARADRDRSGLGLALSRALAQATGLELTFALDAGRFRAVIAGRVDTPTRPSNGRTTTRLGRSQRA